MKKTRVNRSYFAELRRGKVKDVGICEGIILMCKGRIDGSHSLPREDNGKWTSPHLDRELKSFDEYAARIYGKLQIEKEKDYAHLGELMDSISTARSRLEAAKADLAAAVKAESEDNCRRRYGEEHLTNEQVTGRRRRESAARLAPLKAHVNSLSTELKQLTDEVSNLHKTICEDNNSVRMVCERVRSHVYQRICVYWNAALKKHPESANAKIMPAAPAIEICFDTEKFYMAPHKELLEKADELVKSTAYSHKEVSANV